MQPKIIFIINCLTQQRCLKRVQEFIDHGYEVAVYGFERKCREMPSNVSFPVTSLGVVDSSTSYVGRIRMISSAIKQVTIQHQGEDALYYLFSLDMALCALPWVGRRYIYEESDLVHAYAGNKAFEMVMERLCKLVIRRSQLSVFTSEGFVDYHFGDKRPANTIVVTNRVNAKVVALPQVQKKASVGDGISVGFVGIIRYASVYNICKAVLEANSENEVHLFGIVADPESFDRLKKYKNCYFHGTYRNPDDLPTMYSQIDVVLSTYDLTSVNVKYLEPNKLYEAIYFRTPIIVTRDTFLAKKVAQLNVGFEVNGLDEDDVQKLLGKLTQENIIEKGNCISQIDRTIALNINEPLFNRIEWLCR